MSPVDFQVWLNHFEHHAEHPSRVPPGLSDVLRPDERRLIASSIATFQLGEQSEGRTLLQAAQRFADVRHIPAVVRVVALFIREEQRHATLLRTFMQDHAIPLKRSDWTDRVFRVLRRLASFELYLYVRALGRVLVSDELAHVGFESQLLLALRADRATPVRALMRLGHRALIASAAIVVWFTHRPVLRQGGFGMRSFLRACRSQHAFYLESVDVTLASPSVS